LPEVDTKAQKPRRKGKQAPSEQADGQQRRAAPAPAKAQDRVQKQQRVIGSKQALSGSDNEQQTDNAAAVSPVSKGKQQPAKRGRKAFSDNRAEQDDSEAAASEADTTAVASPAAASPKRKKGAAVKKDQKAAPTRQKALPRGQKIASKGQDKAHPAAKAKPAAKRHQPG